ncbi:MAG: KAP family NTPase [Ruminococcus flavefaciens]|nr:KAP family NTPase [Ruminococcus flavefaciens]
MDSNSVDVLNREAVITDIYEILSELSERKSSCIFAIEGGWGVGKTYILNELEKQLEIQQCEETADDRYYIFHYNCWQYDYYEEPSIAIISAMIDKFESEVDKKVDGIINDSWTYAKDVLEKIASEFIKNKVGIDCVEIYKNIRQKGKKRKEQTYQFDELFAFKKTIDYTRSQIKELSSRKTVLIVVDELDRCMPGYAIKVLERLHHIFEGIDNVIVVLAIDSIQLEHSVKEIYGDDVDTERYLRKFINFSVKLDNGELQDLLVDKYKVYFDHFEDIDSVKNTIVKFVSLCEIDIRNLDRIFERLNLIHEFTFKDKVPGSVLLFEIIWGMLSYKTINSRFDNDFYWLPEIDHATYDGLNKYISENLIKYLKELKYSVISREVKNGMPADLLIAKRTPEGYAYTFLDYCFAKKKTFYIDKNDSYFEYAEQCKRFDDFGKRLK